MRLSIRQLASRGDTIVEVMIAIAVISSVLAGAFSVTQKSSKAVRDSQEKGEMMQLLQGQIELIREKALAAQSTSDAIYSSSTLFCMNPADGTRVNFGDTIQVTNTTGYPDQCKNLGPGSLYAIAVRYDATGNYFKAEGRWDGLSGTTNTLDLFYRISPGSAAI